MKTDTAYVKLTLVVVECDAQDVKRSLQNWFEDHNTGMVRESLEIVEPTPEQDAHNRELLDIDTDPYGPWY